ncbi:hypothetical protein HYH03_002002 [Edaphochlamys debaryana]|uniref:Glycosyl transferase 48 domain-containing protein n=1 Tax=Edaphochlamys debaryana TaxID=47281 RepID=A0A835YMK4_9CHLO|nr:hypothetical protein HYH03_002002 [Edaphochlamys debaryana]|eukprot:KAG2500434.1 hypothetical protein HYH03_002002 [Edaphochlamys debaryana]
MLPSEKPGGALLLGIGSRKQDVETLVVAYSTSLAIRLGFATFAPKASKASGNAPAPPPAWHPSTAFVAAASLSAALNDVASRTPVPEGTVAGSVPHLAAAARQLHALSFQPYATWLKAVRMPVPIRSKTDVAEEKDVVVSLHQDVGELALWWLLHTESANLRHTPEALWFLFFCASVSDEATAVLGPRDPADLITFYTHLNSMVATPTLKFPVLAPSKAPSGASSPSPKSLAELIARLHALLRASKHVAEPAAAAGSTGPKSVYGSPPPPPPRPPLPPSASPPPPVAPPLGRASPARPGVMSPAGLAMELSPADVVEQEGAEQEAADEEAADQDVHVVLKTAEVTAEAAPALPSSRRASDSGETQPRPTTGEGASSSTSATASLDETDTATSQPTPGGATAVLKVSPPVAAYVVAIDPARASSPLEAYAELLRQLVPPSDRPLGVPFLDQSIARSLEAYGDDGSGMGSDYLRKIVQPLFHFLMEQIYLLGQLKNHGMEAAVRVSYDDVTESMSHPEVFAALRAALLEHNNRTYASSGSLRASKSGSLRASKSVRESRDLEMGEVGAPQGPTDAMLWRRLMCLGTRLLQKSATMAASREVPLEDVRPAGESKVQLRPTASAGPRVPLLRPALPYFERVRLLMHGPAGTEPAEAPKKGTQASAEVQPTAAPPAAAKSASDVVAAAVADSKFKDMLKAVADADIGASFWATVALRKTFVEHRSVAMPLIAFGRMVKFQLCWFYLLCAWAWSGDHDRSRWLASTTALHWALTVLLWSMQAVLSGGVWIKRTEKSRDGKTKADVVVPYYRGRKYKAAAAAVAKDDGGVAPPPSHGGIFWWTAQVVFLGLAWFLLAIVTWGVYKPGSDAWRWLALAYGILVIAYELLWRQFNFGGFARQEFFETLQRLLPGGPRVTSASTGANPIFDPTIHLRTGLKYLFGNLGLWIFTLALKFVFDYLVLVKPATSRMQTIIDTNTLAIWGGNPSHIKVDLDPLMAAMQVILLFLLSMVSTNVAYSVSTALFGCLQGTRQGLGSVRNWSQIRASFSGIQKGMAAKLVHKASAVTSGPAGAGTGPNWQGVFKRQFSMTMAQAGIIRASAGSVAEWERREATAALMAPMWNALVRSLRQRDLLSNKELSNMSFMPVTTLSPSAMLKSWREKFAMNKAAGGGTMTGSMGSSARTQGLNSIVIRYNGAEHAHVTYLPPLGIYIAQITQMVNAPRPTAEQLTVLQEAYVYLLSLLTAVGAVPKESGASALAALNEGVARANEAAADGIDPQKANVAVEEGARAALAAVAGAKQAEARAAVFGGQCAARAERRRNREGRVQPQIEAMPAERVNALSVEALLPEAFGSMAAHATSPADLGARREVLVKARGLLDALIKAVEVYQKTATAATAVAQRDGAVEGLGGALHAMAGAMMSLRGLPKVLTELLGMVVEKRHFLSDHALETMHVALMELVQKDQGPQPSASMHSPRLGEPSAIPSSKDLTEVSRWLKGILAPTDEGAVPASAEALGMLAEFCSTLNNPNMPAPPTVAAMRSVTTLIPHYHETVIYALSSNDAKTVLGGKVEGTMSEDEVLFVSDDADKPKPSAPLSYLLSEFPEEVRNLLERCGTTIKPLAKGEAPYEIADFLPEGRLYEHRAQLLLWASFRGQVLARTVDGMSMYRTALALQAVTDALAAAEAVGHSLSAPQGAGAGLHLSKSDAASVREILMDSSLTCVEELADVLCRRLRALGPLLDAKYGTLVSSQVYSTLASSSKISDRWCAHGVALLLTRYSASLRVSYLEPVQKVVVIDEPGYTYALAQYDSALVRAVPIADELARSGQAQPDEELSSGAGAGPSGSGPAKSKATEIWRRRHNLVDLKEAEVEVLYRMRQPLNMSGDGTTVILGEGKPENQNVALPYCPGVLLQTVDMNQDNSLAQALKLRNTTLEFEQPRNPGQQVAVLGYPEWIFSYRCGLLAELAALTERTFGTQIQRVMGYPSAVRAHYGHPDLWNKLFAMGRAGVSKSNAVQHVSEDAFGGYNALKRGGLSKYVSYISVGKGRDMGLDSILGFEGKISKGCGEQLMSRDVRFLGCHMDFFRSLSFYCTGPGHFIGTWITVFTIQAGLWVQLILLLGSVNSDNKSIAAAIGAVQILQLGTLPILANVFNLWLELGLAPALWMLGQQLLAGGILFHIFRSVTSSFHLARATLFGGASYVATGRGFSLQRKSFTQVYVNYGRSHLYLGADVLAMTILILIVASNGDNSSPVPAIALWSSFLVAIALLAGPFWFTPFYFRMHEVIRDSKEFYAWVRGGGARGVKDSWAEWNRDQLAPLRDETGIQIPRYRTWSIVTLLFPRAVTCILGALVAIAAAEFETEGMPNLAWVLAGSAATWLAIGFWSTAKRGYVTSGLKPGWRWFKATVQVVSVIVVILVLVAILFLPKRGIRFTGVVITLWANYLVASLVVQAATLLLPKYMSARHACNSALRQTDATLGLLICLVLVILTFIGEIGLIMLDKVQTLVQFNDRFAMSAAAKGSTDVVAVEPLKKKD